MNFDDIPRLNELPDPPEFLEGKGNEYFYKICNHLREKNQLTELDTVAISRYSYELSHVHKLINQNAGDDIIQESIEDVLEDAYRFLLTKEDLKEFGVPVEN